MNDKVLDSLITQGNKINLDKIHQQSFELATRAVEFNFIEKDSDTSETASNIAMFILKLQSVLAEELNQPLSPNVMEVTTQAIKNNYINKFIDPVKSAEHVADFAITLTKESK